MSTLKYNYSLTPRDNSGTVVGRDPTRHVILALWAVNGLSIVCWDNAMILIHSPYIFTHLHCSDTIAHGRPTFTVEQEMFATRNFRDFTV